jgi:imidazolonepropionase-like amidohydrolase/Tol biopolymer transport system component
MSGRQDSDHEPTEEVLVMHAPPARRSLAPFALVVSALCWGLAPGLGSVQAQEPRPAWTVDHTWGPTETVTFEVDEGTWMNVDVSPDGRTLVFDLLGDLYTLPIDGGEATRITSGPAFDIQPAFSPDGTRIAFVSDRDGLNNIWTVALDGSDPVQVTDEGTRDLNSPQWSADGEYIFVRKHFVFSRSLGAGEIWMYHHTGGSGVQVTDRPNEQQDQGEPFPSADGRWIYYSQDVTQGPLFQYNKDPNSGIYAIRRRHLDTGEQETVTGGSGGAITPVPHADGRRLAFLKRVREATVLHVRDLDTGEEWPVWDGLEHDQQEAWAIHGPYTRYDWIPGTDELVVWAQGGLWRVDVGTARVTPVPFTARVEQRVHRAVRHRVDVHPDEFRVRMLRHVNTSPDGRHVAYSALGRVWVKEMPDGAARRLTSADEVEAWPSFSPDGRSVVYVSWDDEAKGRVRIAPLSGATQGRALFDRSGHYVEPSFSPDGRTVVFRSVGGDGRRGPTHAEHTGVFTVPAAGGEPAHLRDGGTAYRFSADGTRLYFEAGSSLRSVDLHGGDERTHVSGSDLTDLAVSPDGEWVAFIEGWRVYVARLPRAGRPLTVSRGTSAVPVARVSAEAGANLHWAGSSRALHWTTGPEYFTRALTETFSFLDGAAPEAAEPEVEGVDIGFMQASDRPDGIIALTGARIITASDDPSAHGAVGGVIEHGTLVVQGNRITAVGPVAEVQVPAGAHVVDAAGKTLMPGIVDAHAHIGSAGSGLPAETDAPFLVNLAFGVTTSHDPSNDTEAVFTDAEMLRAGLKVGPRLFSTGTILYGAETSFKSQVDTYEDALMHVRRQKAAGAGSVKSYNQRRRDARQWILEAAETEGINVVPEGGSTFFFNVPQVIDGHTTIEHNLPLANLYDDVVRLWAATEVAYTPTLGVSYGGLSGEYYWYEHTNVWENERLLRFTPRGQVDARSRRRQKAAGEEDYNHIAVSRHVNRLNQAGVRTNTGAHGQLQGLASHWEIWMFVQGGMSELEAIRSATLNPAVSLGYDRDLGSLEVGKLADLIVLEADPLEDIRNTESIEMVMLNGRLYDAWTMNQLAPTTVQRPRLWFERTPPGAPPTDIPR